MNLERINGLKKEVADTSRRLWDFRLATVNGGNTSAFDRDERIMLVTPTGLVKGRLNVEDIVVVDVDGKVIEAKHRPSIETPMHLEVYKRRPEVSAIVHTHSPMALALSVAGLGIPPLTEEFAAEIGEKGAPLVKYCRTGTVVLAEQVARGLKNANAAIMQNHGLIAVGPNLEKAFARAVLVEVIAATYIFARFIGKPRALTKKEIVELGETIRAWTSISVIDNLYEDWVRRK